MAELSRHPEKSTQELRSLDAWYSQESTRIMQSDTLTPAAISSATQLPADLVDDLLERMRRARDREREGEGGLLD